MISFYVALFMQLKRKKVPIPNACTDKITGGQVEGNKVSL